MVMNKALFAARTTFSLAQGRVPGQLVLQWTDHCNGSCPQCGMRRQNHYGRRKLAPDTVRAILDHAAEIGVQALSFTGGEPLLFLDELCGHLDYAGRLGIPFLRTGTNGFFFRNPEKPSFESRVRQVAERLAGTPLRNLWISLDSHTPEVHEQMRGFSGLVKGMEKGLPFFHEAGIFPAANLGINRNLGGEATSSLAPVTDLAREREAGAFVNAYRDAFRRFFERVADLGFTMANLCYPMNVDGDAEKGLSAVYAATGKGAGAGVLTGFYPAEKILLFSVLGEVIPQFRKRLRIFTPLCSLKAMEQDMRNQDGHASYPCRGGREFLFIDAQTGHAYPCGFRGGENLGLFTEFQPRANVHSLKCRKCEWECFRDPGELFGPFMEAFSHPVRLARHWRRRPEMARLWLSDLTYYTSRGFFNGRKPKWPARPVHP